jgi:hypothetical protein
MGIPLIRNFHYCRSDQFEQFSADSKKSETPVPIENLGWEWDINGPDAPGNEGLPLSSAGLD